jgi:hypothetical protein
MSANPAALLPRHPDFRRDYQTRAGICARDDGGVLQRGHAGYILVRRVEKPTDNGASRLLCCRVADC